MKSLVIFSYRQPYAGGKIRWGVLEGTRNLKDEPLSAMTLFSGYRMFDPIFRRTENIDTVKTSEGFKAFYRERTGFRIKIPLIGSIVSRFM